MTVLLPLIKNNQQTLCCHGDNYFLIVYVDQKISFQI